MDHLTLAPSPKLHTFSHPGDTPFASHSTTTGPMCFPDWSQAPSGGYPSPRWGYPGQDRIGYHPARTGWGIPQPGKRWGFPPPAHDRLCLDKLWYGQYSSCDTPQEDCLVFCKIQKLQRETEQIKPCHFCLSIYRPADAKIHSPNYITVSVTRSDEDLNLKDQFKIFVYLLLCI